MKILFLSHYFPPEVNAPATRAHEHCKLWVTAGHSVTVVTCAPNHPFGKTYEGYENKSKEEYIDGIRVLRLKTYLSENAGFLNRTLSFISYMLAVIFSCHRFGQYDMVISTSPQFFNGLAGYFVSRLKRLPWLLEIRDLWPDSILAVGAITNSFIINSLYKLEKFCYRKCDRLVVVTESFRNYMIERGIPASKISVIRNGVDLSLFNPLCEINVADYQHLLKDIDLNSLNGKCVVSYVGTHGMAHRLETALHAADLLRNNKEIHFLLVGDGAEREKLLRLKESLGLTNVTMAEQMPKILMPIIWSLTTISLVHLKKDDTFKSVIPSKIFEALAMKKPVLLGVEGESADLLQRSGGGLTFEPENAQQMADAILLLAANPSLCAELGRNGNAYVHDHFDREKLACAYENVMRDLLSDRDYQPAYIATGSIKYPYI